MRSAYPRATSRWWFGHRGGGIGEGGTGLQRHEMCTLRLATIAALVAGLVLPPAGAFSSTPERTPSRDKAAWARYPALRAGLAAAVADPGQLPTALQRRDTAGGTSIPVHIRVSRSATAVADAVRGQGGDVRLVAPGAIDAYVPTDELSTVARIEGVESVWPVLPRPRAAYVSPGVSLHGAAAWQAAGIDGSGVRVGIIDGGFEGLAARLGTELPATVVARCYTSLGQFTPNLADCANDGDTHGTAVAETIADMAPGASLYVTDPTSPLEELQAVEWLLANGVKVINASYASGNVFDGPGDGTSPYADSSYAPVDRAVAGGAFWVNAAGNEGDAGWSGTPVDGDLDRWLEFAPGDEDVGFELFGSSDVRVALRWSDAWSASTSDYDLYLYAEDGVTPIASSLGDQDGSGDPLELIAETLPRGRYEVAVRHYAGAPAGRIQLLVYGLQDGLEHQVAAGTLPSPADSANPGMITVGAVRHSSPGTIEPYSSRGPTLDGRVKPDLVAADCAATTIEATFCGTSQSAPYATGAAALLLQAEPGLPPTALAQRLRMTAVPLGSPVPNSTFGWGRLSLGPGPTPVPVALELVDGPTFEVVGRPFAIAPIVRVVDAGGRTAATGPGAALAVTLTSSGGPLDCPSGTTQPAVGGVVVFTGCSVATAGLVSLTASASGVTPATVSVAVGGADSPAAGVALTPSATVLSRPGTISFVARLTVPPGSGTGVGGRAVEIQSSGDGRTWTTVATATTDATGTGSLSFTAGRNRFYRGIARGGTDLAAGASAAARVLVRQTAILRPTSSTTRVVRLGARTTFAATVRPVPPSGVTSRVSFQVYRRLRGTWRLAATRTVTADANGVAMLAWRWGTRGSWYVRAAALTTTANAASTWTRIERFDVR